MQYLNYSLKNIPTKTQKMKMANNSENIYEAIIVLSLVGTIALILNSKIFVINICDKGMGYCLLFLIMKYIAPLMMVSILIAAVWGYGKNHVKKHIKITP
jgi:hypothetical protein